MGENSKLTKEGIGYIICNCLTKVIDVFVSTFLVAYLLNITGGNILQVGLYYTFLYLGMLFFYSLSSFFLHKVNKLIFYRTSLVLKCMFLIGIALLKESIADYIVPVALFYSVVQGLYWSSYNIMMNEAISSKNIQKFYGYYNIFAYITNVVAPIALGSVIEVGSFIKTAVYAVIICLLLFFTTFLLVSRKEQRSKLDFKEFFSSIKKSKKDYLMCYFSCFCNGLRNATATVITIMIVMTFNSNLSLGSLSSIMALISVLITLVFMKKYNLKRAKILWACLGLVIIGITGILLKVNKTTVVLFNVLYTIAMIIPDSLYGQRRMGVVRVTKKHEFALEHNVLAEGSLNTGRVISFSSLIVASFFDSLNVYKILLLVNLIAIALYCIGTYLMEKRYNKILSKNDTLRHLKEVENDCENYYHYKDTLTKEII